jgi:hypothetical protein
MNYPRRSVCIYCLIFTCTKQESVYINIAARDTLVHIVYIYKLMFFPWVVFRKRKKEKLFTTWIRKLDTNIKGMTQIKVSGNGAGKNIGAQDTKSNVRLKKKQRNVKIHNS